MKSSERIELERMALMAEVAREFVHECANFLNTMRLQFAIWEQSPDKVRDWSRIQSDAQKLFGRLHEWHEFRVSPSVTQNIDLTRLLRQLAADLDSQRLAARVEFVAGREPEFLTASPGDLRRLFLLLIESVFPASRVDRTNRPVVKIQLEPAPHHIEVRLQFAGIEENALCDFASADSHNCSLLAASCRALAIRLDVDIRVEKCDVLLQLAREQL